jgi:hypothetical protein
LRAPLPRRPSPTRGTPHRAGAAAAGVAALVLAGLGGAGSTQAHGAAYPAASRYVTAVGGTAPTKAASTTRGRTESVWRTSSTEGTGSGCSSYDTKPSRQTDTGWYTSASALNDVASGNNGTCGTSYLCTAATGHDGPTGWGTPEGVTAFTGRPPECVRVPGDVGFPGTRPANGPRQPAAARSASRNGASTPRGPGDPGNTGATHRQNPSVGAAPVRIRPARET